MTARNVEKIPKIPLTAGDGYSVMTAGICMRGRKMLIRHWVEVEVESDIDYTPGEKPVYYPNTIALAHPGSPPEYTFNGCTLLLNGKKAALVDVVHEELTHDRMRELVEEALPDPWDEDRPRRYNPLTEDGE